MRALSRPEEGGIGGSIPYGYYQKDSSPRPRPGWAMAIVEKIRSSDGIKCYYIDFRDQHGVRVREVAGTTRTQAKKLLTRRLGEVRTGTYVNPRRVTEDNRLTFDDFAERFLEDYVRPRCRSSYYDQMLRRDHKVTSPIRRYFGRKRLSAITERDLDRFQRDRSREVGPSTVRKNLTLLATMFRTAKRWGLIRVNPTADLVKPPEPRHRVRYLGLDEWQRLIVMAEPWLKPILGMAICTGARLKEVVSLRWDNVDREAGWLYLTADNKTATPRQIPLGKSARTIIEGQVRHVRSPFVFTSTTGETYVSTRERNRVSQRTRAAMRAAGIADASFHTVRHTVGSWLGQRGFSEAQIGALLGHAAATMTGRYVHFQADSLRAMVDALDGILDGHLYGHLETPPAVSC